MSPRSNGPVSSSRSFRPFGLRVRRASLLCRAFQQIREQIQCVCHVGLKDCPHWMQGLAFGTTNGNLAFSDAES